MSYTKRDFTALLTKHGMTTQTACIFHDSNGNERIFLVPDLDWEGKVNYLAREVREAEIAAEKINRFVKKHGK